MANNKININLNNKLNYEDCSPSTSINSSKSNTNNNAPIGNGGSSQIFIPQNGPNYETSNKEMNQSPALLINNQELGFQKIDNLKNDLLLNEPLEAKNRIYSENKILNNNFDFNKISNSNNVETKNITKLNIEEFLQNTDSPVFNSNTQKLLINSEINIDNINNNNTCDFENVCLRSQKKSEDEIIENEDFIEYKGKKIFKPFVEKPSNGDDHNIYIYYPPSLGGGHKRLFRKTKILSSLYIPNEDSIRRDKSYIYEEFLQTDGFDIKVYTIGPDYFHAEARKAPSLDGVVRRSPEGKEVRYPVNLTTYEKEICRKIIKIFKQNICGFDILRSKGKSYVCDVNGWSFVKGNRKYYEDCVVLIRKMILMQLDPKRYERKPLSLQIHVPTYEELILPHRPKPQNQKYNEELRSVVSIFRHGDRSPKQKMKLVVTEQKILNLYEKYANNSKKEIKLKKPKQLMEVLNLTQEILSQHNIEEESLYGINDTFINKIIQLKMVLEKNVNFEGMTRKVILKNILKLNFILFI